MLRKGLVAGFACLVGVVVYVLVVRNSGEAQPPPEQQVIDATVARIAAESREALPEPDALAIPKLPGTEAIPDRPEIDVRPSPPDGYSFVAFDGAMPVARIQDHATVEPRAERPEWLDSPTAIQDLVSQASAAGRPWSFGWIRLSESANLRSLATALQGTGAAIVGSAGALVRARLPGDEAGLEAIMALPEVAGMGVTPRAKKLSEEFVAEVLAQPAQVQVPVFITLITDDADGRWRRALEELGAVVGRFDPSIRVYAANVTYGVLEPLARADFVLAIEPVGIVEAAHDTAVPAMGADAIRAYTGSPGLFSGMGGASVPIAVMDTGLNINHLDIASHRESICGANFVWLDFAFFDVNESEDLWIDEAGHGTHVTGTVVGNGYVEPRFAGMAPAVGHIRFAKVLSSFGFGTADGIVRAMDFLSRPTGCVSAGQMSARVKPLIVNMSLSDRSRVFEGRTVDERKLDSIVWGHQQLYVVAQSNLDVHGFSNYASAKNSLAVGAAFDSGEIVPFSSHGPTADGRMAPQVVATGFNVSSARGDGSRGEYRSISGTSMASPTVAGIAALLMDASPDHQEEPALVRARLMASAARPDAWLEDSAVFPSNNTNGPGTVQAQYGMGNVSARTSILNRDDVDGWVSGSATADLEEGTYAYQDIVVPEDAARIDVVMTWDEPPTDAIADTVLNDLDLWLDKDGDCEEAACGEHVSASRIDNVEWIIVREPEPGTYRARVAAHRVLTDAPRAALAWTVIRGASTPNLTVGIDKQTLTGEERDEFTVTVSADAYVAKGTRLHVDCRDASGSSGCDDVKLSAVVEREDSISVDLSEELVPPGDSGAFADLRGVSIPLGEIGVDEDQEVTFFVSYDTASNGARLYFTASAWNAAAASATVDVQRSTTEEFADVTTPANDDFAMAQTIEGGEGSHAVDLLLATPEPGEPTFTGFSGRPVGSVWYAWTAPESGAYRFEASASSDAEPNYRIDVFKGDRVASLERIASNLSGATLFAEEGAQYRIRLSHLTTGYALTFRWTSGSPPANDDFAMATLVESGSGTMEGTSGGATLERGEWFGEMAATTWYRWVAPTNGDWTFSSDRPKVVLVLEGDDISSLRLVSQYPGEEATFPGTEGNTYRIVVAEPDAYTSSGAYTLRWSESNSSRDQNDDVLGAELLESVASSRHRIDVSTTSTVEHGESPETGVRTKWWTWTAPEEGRFTWRLEDANPRLRIAVFDGESVEALALRVEKGPDAIPFSFAFDAVSDQQYWISAGFATGDLAAYTQRRTSSDLVWGRTPANDDLANAGVLEGEEGSVTGTNEFATTERGQRTSVFGHSTLWWAYEAPAAGWYRFSLDSFGDSWVLTVHRDSADGLGGLEIIRSSTWQRSLSESSEVVFYAEADTRYTIALGTRGEASGEAFGFRWAETDAPAWLTYTERLADGEADADGETVAMRGLNDLAFNGDGDVLYLASSLGLQVFERDSGAGSLSLAQSFDDYFRRGVLLWDSHRTRLMVDDCGTWRAFSLDDDASLEDDGELTVADDPGRCGDDLFMDTSGSTLYRIGDGHIDLFEVEDSGGLRFVQTHEEPGLRGAVISNGDSHVYAITKNRLHVYTRDSETGALTRTDTDTDLPWGPETLAISDDDGHLFVFDRGGERTNLFQLEDPANPVLLDDLPAFWNRFFFGSFDNVCRFASVRKDELIADVICAGSAYVVKWDSTFEFLAGTDYIADTQPDRNNNHVPEFGTPADMAASPDGVHVYVATDRHGILVFERIGLEDDEEESE